MLNKDGQIILKKNKQELLSFNFCDTLSRKDTQEKAHITISPIALRKACLRAIWLRFMKIFQRLTVLHKEGEKPQEVGHSCSTILNFNMYCEKILTTKFIKNISNL